MKKTQSLFLFAFITVVLLNLAVPVAAIAEEGTCYLEATTDVFVMVYDLDRQGNSSGLIWQGRLNDGETTQIKAPHGRFRYKYNSEPDKKQPLSSGPDKWCDSNTKVGVP